MKKQTEAMDAHQALEKLQEEVERLRLEKYILERQLDMKDRHLRLVLDQAPIMLTGINADGLIELSIGKGLKQVGIDASTLIAQNFEDAFSVYPSAVAAVKRALKGEQSEVTLQLRSNLSFHNVYVPVRDSSTGEVTHVYAISTDLSEANLHLNRVGQYWEQLEQILQNTRSAMAVLDTELRYLKVSNDWCKLYGLEDKNIIGQCHYDVFPNIPTRWRETHQRCLHGAIEQAENDFFEQESGVTTYLNWKVSPWYDENDKVAGLSFFTEVLKYEHPDGRIEYPE